MNVLQEIFRSNGRSVNLLQHKKISVGRDRGLYYVRAEHETGTREVVTVYLTESEVDQLIELRQRKSIGDVVCDELPPSIAHALRGFALMGRKR